MERNFKNDGGKVKNIIADAGGTLVGRTKLQKTAYLLEVAGEGEGFHFDYHHYGPYSEELASAAFIARATGVIREEEKSTTWGGSYSIYTTKEPAPKESGVRQRLIVAAAEANSVVLELAATAAYFAKNGKQEPWEETQKRKPDKAGDGRLDEAKKLYKELRGISQTLPDI